MANWAFTDYVIEGPKDTLQKIYEALLHHTVEKGSAPNWEGNTLAALGIDWKRRQTDGSGYYMRGFIYDEPWWGEGDHICLRFSAEEAWGLTDFHEVLEKNLPVKVYYYVEEEGEDIYVTNDKKGKYFPARFYVDTAIANCYNSEYFSTEERMWEWLSSKEPSLISKEAVEKWNTLHEETLCDDDENFIHIYKIEIAD